jgi:hypothetical protein
MSEGVGGIEMCSASYDPSELVHAATLGMTGVREAKPSPFVVTPMPSPDDAIPKVYNRRHLKVPLQLLALGRPSLLQNCQKHRPRNVRNTTAQSEQGAAGMDTSCEVIDLTVDDDSV